MTSSDDRIFFVQRKELNFEPNHASSCMILGDVDDDGHNELIVGGLDGSLAIFKGMEAAEAWVTGTEPCGPLKILTLGRLWPWLSGPQLVALTVDARLHVFDLSFLSKANPGSKSGGTARLSPTVTVAAPYNVTAAVTADILEGGKAELILAVDDGSLYVMQWIHDKDDDSPRQPEAQLRLANWKASAGITSLSAVRQGQPSSFVYLVMGLETGTVEVLDGRALGPEGDLFGVDTMMAEVDIGGGLPLPTSGWCGPLVCCPGEDGTFAVASMDGRVALCRIQAPSQVPGGGVDMTQRPKWSTVTTLMTNRPLFSVSPFTVGRREEGQGEEMEGWRSGGMAACAWSGMTWLMEAGCSTLVFDPSKRVVPPVRAFAAGDFNVSPGRSESCLIYSCSDGKILVFHDLAQQARFKDKPTNLIQRVHDSEEIVELLQSWMHLYLNNPTGTAPSPTPIITITNTSSNGTPIKSQDPSPGPREGRGRMGSGSVSSPMPLRE